AALDPTLDGRYDLVVNATTVGLEQHGTAVSLPVAARVMHERQTVVDLAYGERETGLVRLAKGIGAVVVDGLEVLVHQGAASLRIWTGVEPPLEVMREAARAGTSGEPRSVNDRT